MLTVERLPVNPIIHPALDDSIGPNINGPSLIRVPNWLPKPLGRYYLYFAHHGGQYIRLAYADDIAGPWRIYRPGTLRLEQTCGYSHVASPDVHLDHQARQLRMYFHVPVPGAQRTFLASSADGLNFTADTVDLGPSYFRVFQHQGAFYCVTMGGHKSGLIMRSPDGHTAFEPGPAILPRQRHVAVQKCGNILRIIFSRAGDCPEHLLLTTVSLEGDWHKWQTTEPVSLLEPETDYEGADLPLEESRYAAAPGRVRQLRDPCIFEDDNQTFLLYSCAGESGIAIARLIEEGTPC